MASDIVIFDPSPYVTLLSFAKLNKLIEREGLDSNVVVAVLKDKRLPGRGLYGQEQGAISKAPLNSSSH